MTFDRRDLLKLFAAAPAIAAIPNLVYQNPITPKDGRLPKGEGLRPNATVLLYDADNQVIVKGRAYFEVTRRYIEAVPPIMIKRHGEASLGQCRGMVIRLDECGEVYNRPFAEPFFAESNDSLEVQVTCVRQGWSDKAHQAALDNPKKAVQQVAEK